MEIADIASLKSQLLSLVPPDGGPINNKRLRELLGCEPDVYEQLRAELVQERVITLGRGRWGTVRRLPDSAFTREATREDPPSLQLPPNTKREADLYPSFLQGLRKWAKDQAWDNHIVKQTAHQGRRSTGGDWTRPDFVVAGYKRFEYTPGVVRDVETFEVKLSTCGIDAVFETAAHSRVATKSYLAIQCSDQELDPDLFERMAAECQRFGVGLLTFVEPEDFTSWDFRVEAVRHEPDPSDLETFVDTQLDQGAQRSLRTWLR